MKILPVFLCLTLCGASLRAGQLAQELDVEYSYVGSAKTKVGHGRNGNVTEQANVLRYVVSPQIGDSGALLRIGGEWDRYSFGLPSSAVLPNTLQSFSLIAGIDLQLFDSWLVRIEAQPGFYSASNDITARSFNIPFVIGGSYLVNPDLQWVVGASVDVNRSFPVFPAIGLRWKFSEKWTLNAILPRPRLEYEWSNALTLYAGGDLRGGTYRADTQFGGSHGIGKLDNAIVEYEEIRAGAGAKWKISNAWTAEIETGYMPYRQFDFHRADSHFTNTSGAAYGQFVMSGRF